MCLSFLAVDGYSMAYKPIVLSCILFIFIEIKIDLISFLYDVCNEVYEHMLYLSEL